MNTLHDRRLAWLAALAIAVHILESALPSPLPGVKPGLANVITLLVLLHFGWRACVWVTVLRVLLGSLLSGTFLSPTFVLSAGGATVAVLALGAAYRGGQIFPAWRLGPLGYSVLAAITHMTAQFLIAWALFIQHPGLWQMLPLLLTFAAVFGVVSGLIVHTAQRHVAFPPP